MKAILYRVRCDPEQIKIRNSNDEIRKLMGGDFEAKPLTPSLMVIINKKGKESGLPWNRQYLKSSKTRRDSYSATYHAIFGDFLVVRDDGSDFIDVLWKDLEAAKAKIL